MKTSLEQYLKQLADFADSEYGKMIRSNFADIKGSAELAMLAAPTAAELTQLEKAVAIMTPNEKDAPEDLTDEQVQKIASDADIDTGMLAIFINGYALHCRKNS
jgi:hypothetical protein